MADPLSEHIETDARGLVCAYASPSTGRCSVVCWKPGDMCPRFDVPTDHSPVEVESWLNR